MERGPQPQLVGSLEHGEAPRRFGVGDAEEGSVEVLGQLSSAERRAVLVAQEVGHGVGRRRLRREVHPQRVFVEAEIRCGLVLAGAADGLAE